MIDTLTEANSKVCKRCDKRLALDCFHPKKVVMHLKHGDKPYHYRQLHCRACNAIYQREYRARKRIERLKRMAEEHLTPLVKELNAFLHNGIEAESSTPELERLIRDTITTEPKE